MSSEVRDQFAELIPLLARIEETFPANSATTELAQQIRVALCTRGAYSVPSATHSSRCVPEEPTAPKEEEVCKKKRLIEELPESNAGSEEPTSAKNAEISPKLIEIFEQLKDPFIPVRGHALIELSRLLEAKDPAINNSQDEIYNVS